MEIPTIIELVFLGLFIGVFSGLLGIGGGTVLVPAFRLIFSMDPLAATATSLFTIIPTSIAGASTHIRQRTAHIPLGLIMGIAGACTSSLGVLLANISPGWAVMLIAALVIGYSAASMLYKAIKLKPTTPNQKDQPPKTEILESATSGVVISEGEDKGSAVSEKGSSAGEVHPIARLTGRIVAVAVGIGLVAGLLSGYVGVGGGFIMVPLMVMLLGVPMKQASGTSLVAMIILAIPGTLEQASLGNVNYLAGLVVAVGTVPGAIVGSNLARIIPERTLRFIFGGFLGIAAALLAINEFMLLG